MGSHTYTLALKGGAGRRLVTCDSIGEISAQGMVRRVQSFSCVVSYCHGSVSEICDFVCEVAEGLREIWWKRRGKEFCLFIWSRRVRLHSRLHLARCHHHMEVLSSNHPPYATLQVIHYKRRPPLSIASPGQGESLSTIHHETPTRFRGFST